MYKLKSKDLAIYSEARITKGKNEIKMRARYNGENWGQGECTALESEIKNENRDYD